MRKNAHSRAYVLKSQRKNENIFAETFCVNVAHNVAWVSKQERIKTSFERTLNEGTGDIISNRSSEYVLNIYFTTPSGDDVRKSSYLTSN